MPAKIGQYPWVVSIVLPEESSNVVAHQCGGSVIASNWVLTAAHCVVDKETDKSIQVDVLTGTVDLTEAGQRIPVMGLPIVHSGWNRSTYENDLALLKLGRAVDSAPVDVLKPQDETRLAAPETMAEIAGWGYTIEGGRVSAELQWAHVPIVDQDVCKASFGDAIKPTMICAGYEDGRVDACQGDSGGPLAVKGNQGQYILVGVVSWGKGCARPKKFGVYTRTSKYSGWISQHAR